jgi:hypothetical protein
MQLIRTVITLSPQEQQQLERAVREDAAAFVDRLAGPLEIERIEQPWFRRHRILEIGSPIPFPARRVYVAVYGGGVTVLSSHLEHLQRVAAHDPPFDLDDETNAVAYATYGNAWTRVYANGELKIGTFSDIPWHANLGPEEQTRVDELGQRLGGAIAPEQHRQTDAGWVIRTWWVAHRMLIEREVVVPLDGQLKRNDIIHAEDLPLPSGQVWRMVHGRYLPVG